MQANPPKDAAEAHEDLEKAYADVHAMTPEALKHAYVRSLALLLAPPLSPRAR